MKLALQQAMLRCIRTAAIILIATVASACDGGGSPRSWFGDEPDGRVVTSSPGDAELDGAGRLEFEVTSDLYRRWRIAHDALRGTAVGKAIRSTAGRALSQEELDAAVAQVEESAEAREPLASAGMSALEYVYTTVALEQSMAIATGEFVPRRDETPRGNVDVAHQDDPRYGAGAYDTVVLPPPTPYEPLPPVTYEPLPPATYEPIPSPQYEPTPPPLPAPLPTQQLPPATRPSPAQPVPTPVRPSPRRDSVPIPSSAPAPRDTVGGAQPAEPPPVDTLPRTARPAA